MYVRTQVCVCARVRALACLALSWRLGLPHPFLAAPSGSASHGAKHVDSRVDHSGSGSSPPSPAGWARHSASLCLFSNLYLGMVPPALWAAITAESAQAESGSEDGWERASVPERLSVPTSPGSSCWPGFRGTPWSKLPPKNSRSILAPKQASLEAWQSGHCTYKASTALGTEAPLPGSTFPPARDPGTALGTHPWLPSTHAQPSGLLALANSPQR